MSNATTITATPGLPYVDIERVVDAPVADVFRAYTEVDLVKQWLGPRRLAMEVHEYDVRAGGSYAYVHIDDEGRYEFRGVFHSVVPQESIVQTFEWLGSPGHISLDRTTFEPAGDGTVIRTHTVFQTVEDRDLMIEHGMADGVTQGFERMDELFA